jgi:hypothetical protein
MTLPEKVIDRSSSISVQLQIHYHIIKSPSFFYPQFIFQISSPFSSNPSLRQRAFKGGTVNGFPSLIRPRSEDSLKARDVHWFS